ncbi:feruloyl esterase b [Colletotrichum kahawae]|uniref:Carboxylic ester hydrolase n=1 Tax=Colletotrichum kahawae TaxID=34407 RepID=A0AAD9YQE5_COLKA|nr:feruloyl esterase b [Colletotrichum kahawae]
MKSFTTSAALLLPAAQVAMAAFADDCANFAKSFAYENTTVWFTSVEPAGANLTFPERHPTCSGTSQVVDVELCRVSMLVTTGATSNISLEAWLPSNWTGRFLSTGNGGTGGCIQYEDMAYATSRGFATVGANNGHNGTVGEPFYNNPGVIEDFAYRSLHTGVVVGKNVTKAFYGKEHTRSYYLGCSTGGRQGFKEAQDFPDDFDGIWGLVVKDVLTQCDGLDGHVDGIIEDPDLCQYRPESLICGAGNSTNCLTGTQAETVRSVFSDVYGVDGSLVYPRLQPGADATNILLTGTAFPYTRDWFRYVVYNDPNWDPATLALKDMAYSSDLNPFDIATWKGDLSAVKDRGTKILHYHGLQDPIISSDNSARYYNHVSRTMGLTSAQLDDFYRYFRISGMNHCSGGPGATFIGNKPAAVAGYEAEGNVLSAIVHWAEDGIAPESILGTAYVNGTKDAGVAFTRKHCKYPTRNVYSGSGDPNIPESWNCV